MRSTHPITETRRRLELGVPVTCRDGAFGRVADLVIDPTCAQVTHLVVDDGKEHARARLVPLALVDRPADAVDVRLSCDTAHVKGLPSVQEFAYLGLGELRVHDPGWDVGIETAVVEPNLGSGYDPMLRPVVDPHVSLIYDRVPEGEVELRRRSRVASADAHDLGRVEGLVVDGDGRITQLLLVRGHLWRTREVMIPAGAVSAIRSDAVTVALTKAEVDDLVAVPLRHRHDA